MKSELWHSSDYPRHVDILFSRLRSEKKNLKIPFDIEDAKELGRVLDRYKDLYYFEVMTGICLIYLLWVINWLAPAEGKKSQKNAPIDNAKHKAEIRRYQLALNLSQHCNDVLFSF